MPFLLPIYDCINDFSLFCSCFPKVDAGGFDAFMPHEISQERYIITAIKEALGKSVTKGMRIHNSRVDTVLHCQLFQLPRDTMVVMRSPYLFKKMKPLSCCLSANQERASFCSSLGI